MIGHLSHGTSANYIRTTKHNFIRTQRKYRFNPKTKKYDKITLKLRFNELLCRSATDLIKVIHRCDGQVLRQALRVKSSIIASLIIRTLIGATSKDHHKCFDTFDWSIEQNQNWCSNYAIRRGSTEWFKLDDKIHEMLLDPNQNLWSITQWMNSGPPYEIKLHPEELKLRVTDESRVLTPDKIEISQINDQKPIKQKKNKTKMSTAIKWLRKTLTFRFN